ncbi:MazG nucleotide pyrophosphohydrolase domain-containing protein [Endozoicomonadaceae bacterium StTr2]
MKIHELVHGVEAVSKSYAEKHDIDRTDEWFLLKLTEEVGELTQSYLKMKGQARTQGADPETLRADFEKEVADVLGQVLLLANNHDIDVEQVMGKKWLSWLEQK